jgi:rhodanese-related sulfurtransferase
MTKGTCASCLDFNIDKVVKSKESLKPTWLQQNDFVTNFVNNHDFKLKTPKNYDLKVDINLGPKFASKKILYWAANKNDNRSPIILDAKKAYGNFDNHGVVNSNNKGEVTFKIDCPQVYKAKRTNGSVDTTYFRHLHFVVEKDKNKTWDSQIYTKIVICKYHFKRFMHEYKDGFHVTINALPAEYFAKDHVPHSFNLFHKNIKKMSISELNNWFYDVIRIHYPKLAKLVNDKKINIYELPIITYCAHSKCNASELAIKELMKKGFVNLYEYSGGIQEYRKYIPHDNLNNS